MSSPTKSCTLDRIPTFLLKDSLDVFLTYITAMVNASPREVCLPASEKTAIITPLLKKLLSWRCWRPEELPASIQLDVHVEGRRADCRWTTCRILAVKRSDATVAVGLPVTPFNGNGVTTGLVGHFLRSWPRAQQTARSSWPERCVRLRRPLYLYSTSAAVIRYWRCSYSVDAVVCTRPHPASFLRWWPVSHNTTCFRSAWRVCPWLVTVPIVHCWAFRHHREGRTGWSLTTPTTRKCTSVRQLRQHQ